jgi:hypothetical protein
MMRVLGMTLLAACTLASAAMAAGEEARARRLESVTWSPRNHKLTWTVSEGTADDKGEFKGNSKITYEIDLDAATMELNGEGRRFSKAEAVRVHALMDVVAKYAAESTVWWEAGEGEPLSEKDKSVIDNDRKERKPPRRVPRQRQEQPPSSIKMIRVSVEK